MYKSVIRWPRGLGSCLGIEKVSSVLGLGGGFRHVLWFPLPLTNLQLAGHDFDAIG